MENDRLPCGCCRGPERDRCICHMHQDTRIGRAARVCSRHKHAPHWKEVTEERYDDMLEALPPAVFKPHGFLVGEPMTHRACRVSGTVRAAYTSFVQRAGRFYECTEALTAPEFDSIDLTKVAAAGTITIDGIRIHQDITVEVVSKAVERRMTGLNDPGFCVACGAEVFGVEPDARGYECEACGEPHVYGADELLIHLAA